MNLSQNIVRGALLVMLAGLVGCAGFTKRYENREVGVGFKAGQNTVGNVIDVVSQKCQISIELAPGAESVRDQKLTADIAESQNGRAMLTAALPTGYGQRPNADRDYILITPPPSRAPDAPTGLTATAGDGRVVLNWTSVNGAGFYTLRRSTTATSGYTDVASGLTGTTHTDSALTNGTAYFYVVVAVNATGSSGNSNEVSATPAAPTPAIPGVPTGLTATAGDGKVDLTWIADANATQYIVRKKDASGFTDLAAVNGNNYSVTGLANGTAVTFVVAASNAAGVSANSSEASATPAAPPPVTVPAVPADLTATAGDAKVDLSWTAVTGATQYIVRRKGASGFTDLATVNGTTHSVTGLTNGTAVTFVVAASNTAGVSANSSEASATPAAPPPRPRTVTQGYVYFDVPETWPVGTEVVCNLRDVDGGWFPTRAHVTRMQRLSIRGVTYNMSGGGWIKVTVSREPGPNQVSGQIGAVINGTRTRVYIAESLLTTHWPDRAPGDLQVYVDPDWTAGRSVTVGNLEAVINTSP